MASAILSRIKNTPNEYFYGNFTINVFLEAVGVFLFAKCNLRGKFFARQAKIVACLSKWSFGAYLVHAFFIERLEDLHLTTLSFNAALSVPAISILVWILSNMASAILNKIPFLRKIL